MHVTPGLVNKRKFIVEDDLKTIETIKDSPYNKKATFKRCT